MILLVHMIFGALIASKIQNPVLAVVLAFLSHYFLDFIPHNEYPIDNLKKGRWKKSLPDLLKIMLDFCCGILLVFIFTSGNLIIFMVVFFSILPDGLTVLNYFFPNKLLKFHGNLHRVKIHFLKNNKKISNFWRILSQILIVVVSINLLI